MSDHEGHIIWKDWIFDYGMYSEAGLNLLNGWFAGRRVFTKLSLPVIRVKYKGDGCGPYNDKIVWDTANFGEDLLNWAKGGPHHLIKQEDCDDRYICIREHPLENGQAMLELSVYARIGAYHIKQVWWLLSNDDVGDIRAEVWSMGLSCNLNHWHHPHWRFDFELDGHERHRVHHLIGGTRVGIVSNEGWFRNDSFTPPGSAPNPNPQWLVENIDTGSTVTITPDPLNEPKGIVGPDTWSPFDVYVRKYRPEEDGTWPFHETTEMGYAVHEPVDAQNVVFWNIGHLYHLASEGEHHMHGIGAWLRFWPAPLPTQPHQRRRIGVSGVMHLKDFRAVGKDKWSHPTFGGQVVVEPSHPHREIRVEHTVGDIRAELLLIFDWQADDSVHMIVWGRLFDEGDDVARKNGESNVLRDSVTKVALQLRDWHVTDPDTTDIEFKVENMQA
jgi:hypothetical protein